ncbi:MAG: hypothetical protein WBE20_11770 [Candidatus Acidiferrales bacterium]
MTRIGDIFENRKEAAIYARNYDESECGQPSCYDSVDGRKEIARHALSLGNIFACASTNDAGACDSSFGVILPGC